MASKRKKSRPTKLAGDYNLHMPEEDYYLNEEYSTSRIQRFIDHESEDTPESRDIAIKQVPFTNILGPCEKIQKVAESSSVSHDAASQITYNGNAPLSLVIRGSRTQIQSKTREPGAQIINDWQMINDMSASFGVLPDNGVEDENLLPGNRKSADKRQSKLRQHKGKDPQDSPRYSCSMCKYVTNRSDHHKRHLMTHSEDKPLKCTMCSYGTGRSDHYKRHLQRHGLSDAAIIECCAKNGLKLKTSSLTPLDGSKQPAEDGQSSKGKSAKQPKQTPWKKFVCDMCGYTTDKSSHYNRHTQTHSAEKPHSCKFCYKSFKLPLYLNKHRCSKLMQRSCRECNCIFIDHDALMKHAATAHPYATGGLAQETAGNENGDGDRASTGDVADSSAFFNSFTKMASEIIRKGVTGQGEEVDDGSTGSGEADISDPKEGLQSSSGAHTEEESDSAAGDTPGQVPAVDAVVDMEVKGNLKCVKCGVWFKKLDEYNSHSCTS